MEDFAKDLELRRSFKFLLAQNPNHFGNLSELDIPDILPPVDPKVGDTTYEELTCLGYNPDTGILTAIVELKQGSGYSGGPCTSGSREYVRFYADYGDGVWVDKGVTSFVAHDLGFDEDLCYAVSIELDPAKRSCCDRDPVLPKIRAILSWETEPAPDMPNWVPVWGNRLERDVQVEPSNSFACQLTDVLDFEGIEKINPQLMSQIKTMIDQAGPGPKQIVNLPDLVAKAADDGEDKLLPLRQAFPLVAKMAADKTDISAFQAIQGLNIDLSPFDDFIANPSFDTTYEELHCVGLDRDLSLLHGVIQIKRPSGFSGDLCTDGSKEYIAFYLDFGSGWEYQGTTSVVVHDIPQTPDGGLWYQAALPVNLEDHQKVFCETGQARIRGILSWASAPPANDPDYVPHWGDREDCWIEIKPLRPNQVPGKLTPFLDTIGNMPVDQIDALGYANGDSVGMTFTANQSPFGGAILFGGHIAFPTAANMQYRIMVKGPSDPVAKPFTTAFTAAVTTIVGPSISFTNEAQVADIEGWFNYIPTNGPVIFKSVAGNLLARFAGSEEGLHQVFVEVREAGTNVILATSTTEHFLVDNTRPQVDVEITSGGGNCSKFGVSEVIVGTFSMTDSQDHAHSLSLSVTPSAEAGGGTLAITSAVPAGMAASFPIVDGSGTSTAVSMSFAASTLHTNGVTSGQWELDTTDMEPCGYNIRILGIDRTIVNSGFIGWTASDIAGFCLE